MAQSFIAKLSLQHWLCLCPLTFGGLCSLGQVQRVNIPVHLTILLPCNRRVLGGQAESMGDESTSGGLDIALSCPEPKKFSCPRSGH
jgi:hypothetical protein